MDVTRKIELALYYHLRGIIPSHIKVVKGYDEEELELPCVAVDGGRYENVPIELGNREGLRQQLWIIDIFAVNKQQRDDLADLIYNSFLNNIPVYDYDVSFPPPNPPQVGILEIQDRSNDSIIVFRDLVEKFYWRRKITLNTRYKEI